ncbi:hypothetical protein G6F61_006700 [Rhizopus arrhizus]|nr:hypothetical protein G6F61_006700 [Rhizopus arrhizus]
MSNSSTYKFVYENITDATQIDSSVEEMDLTTESYIENQIAELRYQRYEEQLSATAATRKAGIYEKTARNILKKYEDDNEKKLFVKSITCDNRNFDRAMELCKTWALKMSDFTKNPVFIDEAGFHMHMIRNTACSRKEEPANTHVPAQRGTSLTVFGTIYHRGLVSLFVRLLSASKKQKIPGQSNASSPKQAITKSLHYLNFILLVLDVLDKHMQSVI